MSQKKKSDVYWGHSLKGDVIANKIERTYESIYKQILAVTINASNKHILAEMERTSLKLDIEVRMFKFNQRVSFMEKY